MNLRAADHMICSSTEAVTVLRRQGYARGASVMPLVGVDSRLFYPRPALQVRASLGLDGWVVGYGAAGDGEGVDVLLRAFRLLPTGRPSFDRR